MIWTGAEIQMVRAALASGRRPVEIGHDLATTLRRSPEAIARAAREMKGYQPDVIFRPWRTGEIRELDRRLASGEPPGQIGKACAPRFGRTVQAVTQKARLRRATLYGPNAPELDCHRWTMEELHILDAALDAGGQMKDIAARLAPELRRTVRAVWDALKGRRRRRPDRRIHIFWCAAELEHLRAAQRAGATYAQIAADLGRTVDTVRARASRLRREQAALKNSTIPRLRG